MNKYECSVWRVEESDWQRYKVLCEPVFYTEAESEAKAISNIRYRIVKEFGWKDHDENHGSIEVRYEIVAKLVEEDLPKYEQLRLF